MGEWGAVGEGEYGKEEGEGGGVGGRRMGRVSIAADTTDARVNEVKKQSRVVVCVHVPPTRHRATCDGGAA